MRGRGEGTIRRRQRQDGSIFWEARVMFDGRQRSYYGDTRSEAAAKARAARADADRGLAPATPSITIERYLEQWLAAVEPTIRARTFSAYRGHCAHHIVPAIGRIKLHALTPGHVQAMLAGVVAAGRTEATAQRVRATLSAALHAAQRDHGLARNAASLAKLPKTDRPAFTAEVVTPAEARAILAAFAGSRLEPLVLLSVATGLRQGELLALRWQDVDLAERSLTVCHAVDVKDGERILARPKSVRAQRVLQLPALGLRALDLARLQIEKDREAAGPAWQERDLVFPNPLGGFREGPAVTRNFRARLERNGLRTIRWHALRRVFAALLQDQGVPLERIRDLMGHSALRVTEGYAYTMPDSLRQDMAAIDAALGDELGYD